LANKVKRKLGDLPDSNEEAFALGKELRDKLEIVIKEGQRENEELEEMVRQFLKDTKDKTITSTIKKK